MPKTKEPLYMKWWLWIGIFICTALIVNQSERQNALVESDAYKAVVSTPSHDDVPHLPEAEDTTATYAVTSFLDFDFVFLEEGQTAATTFFVGEDLPAGEYFVFVREAGFGYVLLTRSRLLAPGEVVWQKHFENHTIVNLEDGVYLTTKNATLIPIEHAVVPNFQEGILRAGTYRVGVDMPPGIYTLFPLEEQEGFFSIASTSHGIHAHTVDARNFTEPVTLSLTDGDYVTFLRAEIRK